eukprot:TRINITY_DN12749_c0_g2_i1.p1 TRINITY_DN12749_c0_g2~~TRINITY_DN12749_c0_g2_i1.p1  ORF type:complete len:693 (+),score=71.85 TRINITY_DN12749_c0_g2_i1:49-2127(+)
MPFSTPASVHPQLEADDSAARTAWEPPCTSGRSFITRLSDINTIVIGHGSLAEELVRKRLSFGGRVLWLVTAERPSRGIASVDSKEHATTESEHVVFDLSRFEWKPPKVHHVQRSLLNGEVAKLRARLSATRLFWRSAGPEIVGLQEGERYFILTDSKGQRHGIQVRNLESSPSWTLSGTVLFAGDDFEELPDSCTAVTCIADIDLDIENQEAKPWATVDPMHVMLWSIIFFFQFLGYFDLMAIFEAHHLSEGQLPWWRVAFCTVHAAMGGLTATPFLFGPCLTGKSVTGRGAFYMACISQVTHVVSVILPAKLLTGKNSFFSIYIVQCLAFLTYFIVSMPIHLWYSMAQCSRSSWWTGITRWRFIRHGAWFALIVFGAFGNWMLMYAVALLYVSIASDAPILASILLPSATSLVEVGTVCLSTAAYRFLVQGPRFRNESANATVHGDQKLRFVVPLCLTRAYAEGARLMSIIAVVVTDPAAQWWWPILMSFAFNIAVRSFLALYLVTSVLPRHWQWVVAPDAGTILHQEVRVMFGYPRFIVLFAYAASCLSLKGFHAWPFFSPQAGMAVVLAFAMEVLEDIIVIRQWLPSNHWRGNLRGFYRKYHPLSTVQTMSVDRDGVNEGISLGFTGMRRLHFAEAMLTVLPPALFAYTLLTLLLGAGYVHGVCDRPLPAQCRLRDGLVWDAPLRCGC